MVGSLGARVGSEIFGFCCKSNQGSLITENGAGGTEDVLCLDQFERERVSGFLDFPGRNHGGGIVGNGGGENRDFHFADLVGSRLMHVRRGLGG